MNRIKDFYELLPAGAVTLNGPLGKALDNSIKNRLLKVDYPHLVEPFRSRRETEGCWRCEFWGKIVRSAIRSWRAKPTAKLRKVIDDTVNDVLTTQTPDGCISTYPAELHATNWDIWGRKYILAGLIRYCTVIEKKPEIVKAASALLKHLMKQVGPGAKIMSQCGYHNGMASSSILGQVIQMYWLTDDKSFLDYAKWIIQDGGCEVFQQALDGKLAPENMGNGKAYEMTSCIEGLVEMYRATGDKKWLDATFNYFLNVKENEIFVTGVGGGKDNCGEYWWNGAKAQSTIQECGYGETCVTTTYIRFCMSLLRATGDIRLADEIENSLYNGILGAMKPDGSWWLHINPSPLAGESHKVPAIDQINSYLGWYGMSELFKEDCCLAQGPEAIATAPMAAAMKCDNLMVVNFYEPAKYNFGDITLTVTGGYPDDGNVKIKVSCKAPVTCGIRLRIPSWCGDAKVTAKGSDIPATTGKYCDIYQVWNDGDEIALKFAMPLVEQEVGNGLRALRRGPVLLARDSRLGNVNQPYCHSTKLTKMPAIQGFRCVYALDDGSLVCDYASAGNTFDDNSSLRVLA